MNSKTRNVLLVVAVLLGGGFVYYSATSLVPRMLVTLSKAAPATKVSIQNSFVLGSKILCKADGVDKCSVNVFLSDSDRRPVSGKTVSLAAEGAQVSPESGLTDQMGKGSFDLVSKTEGQVKAIVSVDGVRMDKTVVVTFRGK